MRGINAERFIEKMDNCEPKIDKALVFGLTSLASDSPERMKVENNYIKRVVGAHPDRFVGAGVIDPSWGEKPSRSSPTSRRG